MQIRVRSIFAKIVLWFAATVALSLVGYLTTSVFLTARNSGRQSVNPRLHALFLDDARRAFEEGGPEGLDENLKRLSEYSDADFYLTDSRWKDLVSGDDRSPLLTKAAAGRRPRRWRFLPRSSQTIRIQRSDDRNYRLITVFPSRFGPWDSLYYFFWVPILMAGLCYVLAVHLASPLRGLRRVLERFGRGDLTVRYHLSRRDEIGDLARAFNRMADQITTLLSAERRLLQDVSHELRSPLARLGFAVELAKTSPDREAAMGRIRKEADRLNHLVDELLQLTRAEGDPAATNPEEVDLDELLRELIADCSLEAEAKGCRLVARNGQAVLAMGERELLRRACENVLRNAIRHAPVDTQVEVELSTSDEFATIAVRDHGPGVPPESLSDIFKPFYRVESDRDRSSGGVGLGLAIARRAVELHHGRMTARNANPGLHVVIELPLSARKDEG
jgi:signal transduction histidine kinase